MVNLNIQTVERAEGTLPDSFFEQLSGRATYRDEFDGVVFSREDAQAVGFDNIHMLSETERRVFTQLAQFFALNASVQEVKLKSKPNY